MDAEINQKSAWAGTSIWLPIVIVILTMIISLSYVESGVPREIWMLTGPQGSPTYHCALEYQEYFLANGVTINIESTPGSSAVLRQLAKAHRPQVGFVEAGLETIDNEFKAVDQLVSLGSLNITPTWLFVRDGVVIDTIKDLKGHRIVVGVDGSGARTVAEVLIRANGIQDQIELVSIANNQAVRDLPTSFAQNTIDAAFLMGSPQVPTIKKLIESEATHLEPIRRAAAYERSNRFLAKIMIPEGMLDIRRNVPATDLQVLGLAGNLVATEDIHPAIVDLLLDASKQIYSKSSPFAPRVTFPNPNYISLPLSRSAQRYYNDGKPWVRKHLPFWLATFVDQFMVVIIAVAGVAAAAFSVLPKLINLRFRLALMTMYRKLEQIEKNSTSGDEALFLEQLASLSEQSDQLSVPATQRAAYLEFRQNLHDIRDRLSRSS